MRGEPAVAGHELIGKLVVHRELRLAVHRHRELWRIRAVIEIAREALHVARAAARVRAIPDLELHGIEVVSWRNGDLRTDANVSRVHDGYAPETRDARILR